MIIERMKRFWGIMTPLSCNGVDDASVQMHEGFKNLKLVGWCEDRVKIAEKTLSDFQVCFVLSIILKLQVFRDSNRYQILKSK